MPFIRTCALYEFKRATEEAKANPTKFHEEIIPFVPRVDNVLVLSEVLVAERELKKANEEEKVQLVF